MAKNSMIKRFALIVSFGLLVVGLIACSSPSNPTPTPSSGSSGSSGDGTTTDGGEQPDAAGSNMRLEVASSGGASGSSAELRGLSFRLSQGAAAFSEAVQLAVATGEPLSAEMVESILARLPELETDASDTKEFNLPESSPPPPITGETVNETFPPEGGDGPAEVVPDGPLEVLRFAPEGNIPIAPFVSVTFNQPMAELATIEQLSSADVPVTITPALEGKWKWIGTKSLRFEYNSELIDRFPKSTNYTVEIPAGTQSLTGGTLAETVSWTFQTPTPQVETFYPQNGSQPLEPIFFARFDQRINPEAILNVIQVNANGQVDLRMATSEEIAADQTVARLVENSLDSRWIAFRAVEPFANDQGVSIAIGPNIPSAEGPLTSDKPFSYSIRTYAPLRIEDHECGWYDGDCPPYTPFNIRFNNNLDGDSFDLSMVSIEPELPDAIVGVSGNSITIRGATQGRTTYTVQLSGAIQDQFGQLLGQDETLTFKVGSAEAVLTGPENASIILDPSSDKPLFSVYSINYDELEVKAYRVTLSDWQAYQTYRQNYYDRDRRTDPPGELIIDRSVSTNGVADTFTETAIDLSEALDGQYGHMIVTVRPPARLFEGLRREDRPIIQTWIQVTNIGLDAFTDNDELVVWASSLADGSPIAGAEIELRGQSMTTGEDGTLRLDLNGNIPVLRAINGDDSAILQRWDSWWGDDGWQSWESNDQARWFVFDDRQMYRPGEEVHIKGWVREYRAATDGTLGMLSSGTRVNFTVYGPQYNEIAAGSAELNAAGGFDLAFELPTNANLGYANVEMQLSSGLDNSWTNHQFQVQEFRRPEFEVSARQESTGPYFVGDAATVAVSADYFSGGSLPNADVTWFVNSTASSYSPPNWSEFSFGTWTPWWHGGFYEEEFGFGFDGNGDSTQIFEGKTDASGEHFLQIDIDALDSDKPQPYTIRAEASVMDVNRQQWASSTSLLVHPSDLYVGLRSDRYFVKQGTPLDIETIVTDVDGNAVAGQSVTVTAARLEWQFKSGRWQEVEVDVQTCDVSSASEPLACSFATEKGGSYLITATVTDQSGRLNQSSMTRWVSGGTRPQSRTIEQEQVTLIPNQDEYQPGDVAEILVQSPFGAAEGLLTVTRNGLLTTERFTMSEDTHILQIPIEDAHIPGLLANVNLVGSAERTDDAGNALTNLPSRPAYAAGNIQLNVPPYSRTLAVTATPAADRLEPGGNTTLAVTVQDASGQPVENAELAVVIVDEAILALTGYQLADPIAAFYQFNPTYMEGSYGRSRIVLISPDQLGSQVQTASIVEKTVEVELEAEYMMVEEEAMEMDMAAEPMAARGMAMDDAADGGEAGADGNAAAPAIRVRSDFNPLAVFQPEVATNASGQATIDVPLPDNLTRYRIMVVAAAGYDEFGSAESTLTARLPIQVRPSAPRFLNFGDQVEMPIVIQNQTDEDLEVNVALEASNILLTDGSGRRVTVPANDRVEVRFPATPVAVGTGRIQIAAVATSSAGVEFTDAATVELPIYTPATTEAFATYGIVDGDDVAVQPIAKIEGVFPQFGGLEINTSSTALQSLTDAVLYLVEYRFQSAESMASRILAISALRDVLGAFSAETLPPITEIEAVINNDIDRLRGMQNFDGGFPYWQRGRDSIPFNTIHAVHALSRAQAEGFDVPERTLSDGLGYLQNIESHYPHWYGEATRRQLSAHALYVRHLAGSTDTAKAAELYRDAGIDGLTLEAAAWLWQVMATDGRNQAAIDEISRHISNRAVETPSAANFTTNFTEDAYVLLQSNRRTDAVILQTLIDQQPDSDLIVKVVNGLQAHRTRGHWSSTQENVFVLLALDSYFNTFEAETPDFVARVWLGNTFAAEHAFEGRTTERRETLVPMEWLVEEDQNILINKEGDGRLYYRLGLSYAPDDLDLDPVDMGFVVQRSYAAVDDPEDVWQDADGTWHVKAGARVRVQLEMVADNRRYHVALVDPLPAGLEIVNPALAVSGDIPADPNDSSRGYWWWTWYDHQNMRDDRAEAFATYLWDGVYTYTYVAQATTPGTFVVPPTKAEEMYTPEVFGRSASDTLIVESP